jgi:hypothetical protein
MLKVCTCLVERMYWYVLVHTGMYDCEIIVLPYTVLYLYVLVRTSMYHFARSSPGVQDSRCYYENVRDMEGAGGLHCVKIFKRNLKFKDIAPPTLDKIEASSSQAADAEDGEGTGDDAQSAGAAAPVDAPAVAPAAAPAVAPAAAPAVAPAAALADTAPSAKKAPATRGKGTGRS